MRQLDERSGLDLTSDDTCRDDIDALKRGLEDLGATHVVTYDELADKKAIKAKVNEWTNGQVWLHHIITMSAVYIDASCAKGYPPRFELRRR